MRGAVSEVDSFYGGVVNSCRAMFLTDGWGVVSDIEVGYLPI